MDNLPLKDPALMLLLMVAGILVIVWWPLALIWSVNTLFGTQIPFGLNTWLATVLLVSVLRLSLSSPKKP